jgi:putative membrane protein
LFSFSDLASVNAALNSVSAVFLILGFIFIRKKQISRHKACMLVAFSASTLFLISYILYHYHVGSVPFQGRGWIRPVYYSLLLSHIVLAAAIVPMALVTLARALKGSFNQHRRLARWTLPLWLYVSVTGVTVYWMLYHF